VNLPLLVWIWPVCRGSAAKGQLPPRRQGTVGADSRSPDSRRFADVVYPPA
jgi:hypothetical protein